MLMIDRGGAREMLEECRENVGFTGRSGEADAGVKKKSNTANSNDDELSSMVKKLVRAILVCALFIPSFHSAIHILSLEDSTDLTRLFQLLQESKYSKENAPFSAEVYQLI